jgi:cyanophycinase-like exopeptidase
MSSKGAIVLMGSGELTSTMVEVYKELMHRALAVGPAVFLDTPAGFQLNADQISARAVEYFRTRVGHPISVASYKVKPTLPSFTAEEACLSLKQAGLVLIGPGSPTYAVRQWQDSPIPGILAQRIEAGATLVAASAAALTVGRFTLPVYEIYKVGEAPRWEPGIDLLGRFGFNLVVVPHWNNAEGGTHDTQRCFMGASRFREMEKLLPADVAVLGLDEHTACILDLDRQTAEVRGVGRMALRRAGAESIFEAGQRLPLSILREGRAGLQPAPAAGEEPAAPPPAAVESAAFWETIHALESRFQAGIDQWRPVECAQAILELDRIIWHAAHDLESEEFISQAREILREWVVQLGAAMASGSRSPAECLGPLVVELMALRDHLRAERRWAEADMLRDCLQRAGVLVEDTGHGSRWRVDA